MWTTQECCVLNKPWKQHPTKPQPYNHLPPTWKTILVTHTGHSWRSRDEAISKVLWTPTHVHTSVGRLAKTYILQVCADNICSLGDWQRAMTETDRQTDRQTQGNLWLDNDVFLTQTKLKTVMVSNALLKNNKYTKYNFEISMQVTQLLFVSSRLIRTLQKPIHLVRLGHRMNHGSSVYYL